MKKGFIALIISILLVTIEISASSNIVEADELKTKVPSVASGIILPTQKEMNDYKAHLDSNGKSYVKQKMDVAFHLKEKKKASNRGSVSISGFTIFEQENGYWCGPATLKSIIQYLTGSSQTQSQIALSTGGLSLVDGSISGINAFSFLNYLNSNQSNYYYTLSDKSVCNHNGLIALLNLPLYSYSPSAMMIAPTRYDGWFYESAGHIVAIYGTNSTTNKIQLADSAGIIGSGIPKYYSKDSQTCYKVCNYVVW